jgi:CubicO group peptidase (beta-lactamase class C family)
VKADARRTAVVVVASIFALVLNGCAARNIDPVPTPRETPAARSEAVLEQAVAADSPGCSAAVGEDGKVLWQGVRGMADLGRRTPITTDTTFDVGSVSKQFTATAVLLLANQGKLSTSDPLAKHLAGFPSWARSVTVAQLMHHVSGVPDYLGLLEAHGFSLEEKTSRELALELVAKVEDLNFRPGSRFEYSNSNYLLLGAVVEKVSGLGLHTFLDQNIFEPLGLPIVSASAAAVQTKARSYRTSRSGSGYEVADWHVNAVGAGDIEATPSTLVRWADNYRLGKVGGTQLLNTQLKGAPLTGDLGAAGIGHEGSRYGAGIISDSDSTLWHSGEYGGFHTQFLVLPGRHRSLAVSCNLDDADDAALGQSLTEIWRTS